VHGLGMASARRHASRRAATDVARGWSWPPTFSVMLSGVFCLFFYPCLRIDRKICFVPKLKLMLHAFNKYRFSRLV
jgi:hypothetical protein